jgi:hypothetical protein
MLQANASVGDRLQVAASKAVDANREGIPLEITLGAK